MKPHLVLPLLGWLLAGCHDASAPAPSATPRADSLSQSTKRAAKTVDLAALNRVIENFYVQEGRFPTNLAELAERNYIPLIPPLPEGAHWEYDTNTGIAEIGKD